MTTTGIAQAGVVSVRFFNDAGFLVTVPAARLNSEDGKIVIGAPLYIDPASKNITAGTVSMLLIQGNNFSAPVSLNIQDLPPLSVYGLQPGAVSSATVTLNTSLLGSRLTPEFAPPRGQPQVPPGQVQVPPGHQQVPPGHERDRDREREPQQP